MKKTYTSPELNIIAFAPMEQLTAMSSDQFWAFAQTPEGQGGVAHSASDIKVFG